MPEVHGKVFRDEAGRTAIRFESVACAGCHGCASPVSRDVELASMVRGTNMQGNVTASMSTPALLSVLFHSLGLPLAGFVSGVSFAAFVSAGDLSTALLGAAGLATGVACCRRQTEELIEIEEV